MNLRTIRNDLEINAANVNEFILSSLDGRPKEAL